MARVFSPSAAGVQPSMKAASWSWPPPLAASMAVAPAAFFWPRSAPFWSRTRQDSRKPAAAARWSAVVPSAAAALTSTPRSFIYVDGPTAFMPLPLFFFLWVFAGIGNIVAFTAIIWFFCCYKRRTPPASVTNAMAAQMMATTRPMAEVQVAVAASAVKRPIASAVAVRTAV